jgi:Molybdopterin-binding domain of aldehyde dehydrogenase
MIRTGLPKSILDNPVLARWISFDRPGRVGLCVGKVELGQGITTALAQIAAEELEVSVDRIDSLPGGHGPIARRGDHRWQLVGRGLRSRGPPGSGAGAGGPVTGGRSATWNRQTCKMDLPLFRCHQKDHQDLYSTTLGARPREPASGLPGKSGRVNNGHSRGRFRFELIAGRHRNRCRLRSRCRC